MAAPDETPKPGRPTKLTPELTLELAEIIGRGHFRYVACKRVQLGWTTFKQWMLSGARWPDGEYGTFRAMILEAEAQAEIVVMDRLLNAQDSDTDRWWLERKFPHRYGRNRVELRDIDKRLKEIEKERAAE